MSIISTDTRPALGPRYVLPVAGLVTAALAGIAAAALVRRTGILENGTLELAPAGTTIEFDKGGVGYAIDEEAAAIEAEELAFDLRDGRGGACGIRPTIAVDAAIDEELAEPEPVAVG